MKHTVGRFSLEDGLLSGPAEYMNAQGNAKVDKIMAGDDIVFNMSMHLSPSVESAILVTLQTDYAGWLGFRQMLSWSERK